MPRVAIAVAILALYVYGLVDVIRTDGRLTRGFSKTTWIIMVALLPLIGAALWFLIGRPRATAVTQPVYQHHPTAPDDDPTSCGTSSSAAARPRRNGSAS